MAHVLGSARGLINVRRSRGEGEGAYRGEEGRVRQVCMALPSIQEAAPATREESLYGTMEIITRH